MPFFQVYFNSHHRKRRSWSKFKVTSADPYKKFFISLKTKKTHKNLPQIGERRKKILRKKNQSSRGCGFSLLPGKEKASNLFKIPHRLVFQQVLEVPILIMLTHVTNKSREILHTQSTVTADKNTKKKKKPSDRFITLNPTIPIAQGALCPCVIMDAKGIFLLSVVWQYQYVDTLQGYFCGLLDLVFHACLTSDLLRPHMLPSWLLLVK